MAFPQDPGLAPVSCPACSTLLVGRVRCPACGAAVGGDGGAVGVRVTREQDASPPVKHAVPPFASRRPAGKIRKTCRHCGKSFDTQNRYVTYCSERCQALAKKDEFRGGAKRATMIGRRQCEVCGKELPRDATKLARFCSDTCHDVYYSTHVRAVQAIPGIIACPGCSTLLEGRDWCPVCGAMVGGEIGTAGVRLLRRRRDDLIKIDPDVAEMFQKEVGPVSKEERPTPPTNLSPPPQIIRQHKKRDSYPKVCPHCGKPFESVKPTTVYCSEACAAASREGSELSAVFRHCESCGKEIPPGAGKLKRFCSDRCHSIYFATHVRAVQESSVILACRACSTLLEGLDITRCPICGGRTILIPSPLPDGIVVTK